MRRFIVCVLSILSCACAAEDAEEDYYALSQSGGSLAARCEAARAVEIEWRKRGDDRKIESWSTMRETACNAAESCKALIGGCS